MDFDADACISAMQEEIEWQLEQWRKEREREIYGTMEEFE